MRLRRLDGPSEFLREAGAFLLRREAEHNLILGLAAGLEHGEWAEQPPYLAVVERGDEVVLAALRTPPRNLILSRCDDLSRCDGQSALDLLAFDLGPSLRALPGVSGGAEVSAAFADVWRSITGGACELAMAQRIYQTDRVSPPAGVPGRLRLASPDDRALVVAWVADFSRSESTVTPDAEQVADRFLQADPRVRGLYLWEVDGEPASMVGHSGPTPHGMRVGPVYTPPRFRRRGYASAATAAISQRLLDSGRRFCFLYTDAANPTANHIYQSIGYRPVTDASLFGFTV